MLSAGCPADPSDRTRGNGYILKHAKFHLEHKKALVLVVDILGAAQRSCGVSVCGDNQNLTGYNSEQPAPMDPALAGG